MLKKPTKNPTFNEYFPQQITVDDSLYMFDIVFINEVLKNKIIKLFANNDVYEYILKE